MSIYNTTDRINYLSTVERISKENGIDPDFVDAMIGAECSWDLNLAGGTGALGLMQLISDSSIVEIIQWRESQFHGQDLKELTTKAGEDPEINIRIGIDYLRYIDLHPSTYVRPNAALLAASYNQGWPTVGDAGWTVPTDAQVYVNNIQKQMRVLKNNSSFLLAEYYPIELEDTSADDLEKKKLYYKMSDPKELGLLVIGDLQFTVPPTAINFSSDSQAISIPTLRSSGDPVITSNTAVPRAQVVLYFTGVNAINRELRPLYAMFHKAPFTTVQNNTLHKLMVGKKQEQLMNTSTKDFSPIPIMLEGITLHTVPGFPGTIQANVSLAFINHFPHVSEMKFFKKTEDAKAQARYMTYRSSKAYNTINLREDGNLTYITAEGTPGTAGKPAGGKTTLYPGGSWPFIRHYRGLLREFKESYFADMSNRVEPWCEYNATSAQGIKIQYNSILVYDTMEQNLLRNLRGISDMLHRLKVMRALATKDIAINAATGGGPKSVLIDGKEVDVQPTDIGMFTFEGRGAEILEKYFSFWEHYIDAFAGIRYTLNELRTEITQAYNQFKTITEEKAEGIEVDFTFLSDDDQLTNNSEVIKKSLLQYVYLLRKRKELASETGMDEEKSKLNIAIDKYHKLYEAMGQHFNDSVEDWAKEEKVNPKIVHPIEFTLGWDDTLSPKYNENALKEALEKQKDTAVQKAKLRYNTVVNSIGVSYQNNITPIPILAFENPTFQHMGISNAVVTINLKTKDEDLLARLTDVRQSIAHISRAVASGGNNDLADLELSKITITDGLLNSLGLNEFALRDLDVRSISGSPGWYEITLELVQNEMDLTKFEQLSSIPSYQLPRDAVATLFPSKDFEPYDFFDSLKEEYNKKNKALRERIMDYRFYTSEVCRRVIKKHYARPTAKDAFGEYVLGSEYGVSVELIRELPGGNPYYEFIIEVYNIDTGVKDTSRTKFYRSMVGPLLRRATIICQMARAFENEKNYELGVGSLTVQLEAHYLRYISRVANGIDTLLKLDPEVVSLPATIFGTEVAGVGDIEIKLQQPGIIDTTLDQMRLKSLYILLSRKDFRDFLDSCEDLNISSFDTPGYFTSSTPVSSFDTPGYFSYLTSSILGFGQQYLVGPEPPTTYDKYLTNEEEDHLTKLAKSIGKYFEEAHKMIKGNYPDLDLPPDVLEENGHYIFGPSFYLKAKGSLQEDAMKKTSELLSGYRLSVALQLAIIQGQITNKMFIDKHNKIGERINDLLTKLKVDEKVKDILKLENVRDEYEQINNVIGVETDTGGNITNETVLAYKSLIDADLLKDIGVMAAGRVFVDENGVERDITPQMTSRQFRRLIIRSACFEYAYFMSILEEALNEKIGLNGLKIVYFNAEGETTEAGNAVSAAIGGSGVNTEISLVKLLDNTLNFQNKGLAKGAGELQRYIRITSATDTDGVDFEGEAIQNILIKLYNDAVRLIKNENPEALMNYFGFSDLGSAKERYELDKKLAKIVDTSTNGTMDRAFPTFKLFFIEEDTPNWLLFDDFYTYDAVNSIDVVESKHAASSTAVIKLSNVTNKLTGDPFQDMWKDSDVPATLPRIRLRPGTPILLRLGYGPDYRHLPVVFMGTITEVKPGPVLEFTAQSWGAELTNSVGSNKGMKFGALSPEKTIGSVVVSVLDQLPGMHHFGRWTMKALDDADPNMIPNSFYKMAHFAKSGPAKWLAGWGLDFAGVDTDMYKKLIGDITSSQKDLENLLSGRRPDHLMLNIGNELYDNVYLNGIRSSGYGWANFLGIGNLDHLNNRGNFDWVIYNQTGWDALWEACLHLGDYIVRPLPYNEGTNMLQQPPRMTLYIGPREGYYQHSDQMLSNMSLTDQITEAMEKELKELLDGSNNGPTTTTVEQLFKEELLAHAAELFEGYTSPGIMVGIYWLAKQVLLDMHPVAPCITTRALDILEEIFPSMRRGQHAGVKVGGFTTSDRAGVWRILCVLLTGNLEETTFTGMINKYRPQSLKKFTQRNSSSFLDSVNKEKAEVYFSNYTDYYESDLTASISDLFTTNYSSQDTTDSLINRVMRRANVEKFAANKHFTPVVEHHFVNSWEDIMSNDIIATSDSMYNHVRLLFSGEPTAHKSLEDQDKLKSYDTFIGYDIDPNHIRTYVSYQKNVDPNIIFNFLEAKNFTKYENEVILPNYMNIANQILSNVVKPMYQGSLTLVGNPHIRPWHIVHMYDDITNMDGPVEVEEVVHSFSSERGYTTTIVPNLVIYDRDINTQADLLYLEMLGRYRSHRLGWDIVIGGGKALGKTAIVAATAALFSLAVPAAILGGTYFIIKGGWNIFENYANQTIGMAGIIAGNNPLTFAYLNYNGKPYIAGMEGIYDMGRSISSIVVGQLQKDGEKTGISPFVWNRLMSNITE